MVVNADSGVLAVAGLAAGAIGAAGGVTSLVSYSALLAVGVPALPANVANLVAAVGCWPGSALTSRSELAAVRHLLVRGLATAATGATIGAVLLLSTPPTVFARIVPLLVAAGSLVLLAQPWLTARVGRRRAGAVPAMPLLGLVSIYMGYFGAASGILVLAVLLVLIDDRLPEANALKNMMLGAGSAASAAVFIVAGPVDWALVIPLAVGLFVGSAAGPIIVRRVRPTAIRWAVGSLGIVFAVELWLNHS